MSAGEPQTREARPLQGLRVLVTRPREQAHALAARLREAGAEPVIAPLIEVRALEDEAPLVEALGRIATYDVLALTSANAAHAVLRVLERSGRDARVLAAARVAVIGPGTAEALARAGVVPDLVAEEHVGEGLARAILAAHHAPRVLLPRAKVARDVVPEAIRAAGGICDVVTAYETVAAPPGDVRAVVEVVDVVTLLSPSTARSLAEALEGDREPLVGKLVASIGPVTTAACADLGLRVDVEASPYSTEGLVAALVEHVRCGAPHSRT